MSVAELTGALQHVPTVARAVARRLPEGTRDHALDDLAQEGRIAVWLASERFDEARGIPFVKYALACAKRRMLQWIRWYLHAAGYTYQDRQVQDICSLDSLPYQPEVAAPVANPEALASDREFAALCLSLATPKEAQVFNQIRLGRNTREAGERMGLKNAMANRYKLRLIAKVQAHLSSYPVVAA